MNVWLAFVIFVIIMDIFENLSELYSPLKIFFYAHDQESSLHPSTIDSVIYIFRNIFDIILGCCLLFLGYKIAMKMEVNR